MPTTLTAITLFSGFGLADVGLKQAGFEVVGAVEELAAIAEWYQINHPKCKTMVGSVEEFDYRQFDGIDLLHLSPPCQQYSRARSPNLPRHKGADAGLLALKAIDQIFPKFITLENVPGYLKADAYLQIKQYLWTLGYWLNEEILNADDYGIPQTRRRLISRWIREDALARDEVPISHTAEDLFGGKYWYSPFPKKQSTKKGWYSAIADMLPSLPETKLARWQIEKLPKEIRSHLLIPDQSGTIRTSEKPAFTVLTSGLPCALLIYRDGNRGKKLRIFFPEQPAPTIKAMGHAGHSRQLDGWDNEIQKIVKITPEALARLQTMPDSFQLPENNVLACIGIGNGVPCKLMRQIAASLITEDSLDEEIAYESFNPSSRMDSFNGMDSTLQINPIEKETENPSMLVDSNAPAVIKSLFIPLKRQYFEDFKAGIKRIEYRKVGGQFTLNNCTPGKEVTLSLGYGTRDRLHGTVVRAWVKHYERPTGAIADCYGTEPVDIIAIKVQVKPLFMKQAALPEVQPPQPLVITGTEEVRNPLQQSQLHKKGLCDYVINVASGCLHGCTFCYVPSTPAIRVRQKHLQDKGVDNPQYDWGKYLFVREEIAEQLEKVLANKRTWPETPAGQGVVMLCSGTDPYQNNQTAAITRACVEVLLKYGKRVRVLTRSPLWTQDLDILVNPLVTVGMSLPHLDDRLSRQIEPNAPRPSDRYRALQKGAAAGCRLFVAMAPTPPKMQVTDFLQHLSKLKKINPEVIFWEPINARGTNGLRMLEAGLEFAQDISKTETWAENFINQWRELNVAASLTRCQEILHIWPDRALSGHVSEDELESWWSRPTKEKWPSQQPTQVNQLDILETPKTMLAIETNEEYNLSEDIDIDFERESPPEKIFQFPTSPIAEPYTPQEPEPLTRPLIEEKIVALTDEVKDLEEQARIRREEISQLHQQAKTCLKSEFVTKLKALREIIEGDKYGLTDYFCDELNRLHVELCPSSGCKKTIEETEQPLNTEEAEESDSDREYIPYQGDYPEVVALSNWERENQLSSPEEESSIEQAKNTKTPSLPQDREQDGENWSLEKTGEKNNYCTNFNSHEDNAQPPVRTIPELEKVRSHDPVESKPDQKLSFGDIRIQDGEKWYFERMPNKKSLYCANFDFSNSDAELPEILKIRLTNRGKKPLERICKWAIAEGLASSFVIHDFHDQFKKLSDPKTKKPEANIILEHPLALNIIVEQITSGSPPPASRKWAGEVGQLFFPGDRVRRREFNDNKQWVEQDYIVREIVMRPGVNDNEPPATGYRLTSVEAGKESTYHTSSPWVKYINCPTQIELVEASPDFNSASRNQQQSKDLAQTIWDPEIENLPDTARQEPTTEQQGIEDIELEPRDWRRCQISTAQQGCEHLCQYHGFEVTLFKDPVFYRSGSNFDNSKLFVINDRGTYAWYIKLSEFPGHNSQEIEWYSSQAKIYIDNRLAIRAEVEAAEHAKKSETQAREAEEIQKTLPIFQVAPSAEDQNSGLSKTFSFPDVAKARDWNDWFVQIIGQALSKDVKLSRLPRSTKLQISNLSEHEMAILNNLKLPETIPTPAAAREMWATAVAATTNNITTEIKNECPN